MDKERARPWDLEGQKEDVDKLTPRVIYAGEEYMGEGGVGQPYILVTEDGIQLVAEAKKVISISQQHGVNLQGQIAMATMPDQISMAGGYLCLNPVLTACIPSTTPTPVPTFVKTTPRLFRSKKDLMNGLKNLLGFSDAGGGE